MPNFAQIEYSNSITHPSFLVDLRYQACTSFSRNQSLDLTSQKEVLPLLRLDGRWMHSRDLSCKFGVVKYPLFYFSEVACRFVLEWLSDFILIIEAARQSAASSSSISSKMR